ncbi:MAG: glycosyltransferase family 2 protein [Stagnimonas sp.]|nr:glycosyltransferase family 2 protein [Stagnimonas sp.]
MIEATVPGRPRLGIVTVSYFPDLAVLARQLAALPDDLVKLVIDNTGECPARYELRAMLCDWPSVKLIENEHNIGLAAAFNLGAKQLRVKQCSEILLLDQDSEPQRGAVLALHQQWQTLTAANPRIGAVGPRLCEAESGIDHGFHCRRHGLWVRHHPDSTADRPVAVASLNGSGTLMALSLYQALGGLDESLFIDHVDTEWSFRLQAAGYTLLGLPGVRFEHRMGRSTTRIWLLGWRAWPSRSPVRHYYLYRNTLRLLQLRHPPLVWKFWALARLLLNYAVQWLAGSEGVEQRRQMRRGLSDGWKGHLGPRRD